MGLMALIILTSVFLISNSGPDGSTPPALEIGAAVFLAVAVAGFVLAGARQTVWELLQRPGFDLAGVALSAGALLAIWLFMHVYIAALQLMGFGILDPFGDLQAQGWSIPAALGLIVVAPAITEEGAFRGYLLARLDLVLGPTEALLVQAAVFGIAHMIPLMFISHFVIGLVLGLLRRATNSLYPCMAVHAAWNLWASLT
jgi:membrane protease YdiL (CAAX protease family)